MDTAQSPRSRAAQALNTGTLHSGAFLGPARQKVDDKLAFSLPHCVPLPLLLFSIPHEQEFPVILLQPVLSCRCLSLKIKLLFFSYCAAFCEIVVHLIVEHNTAAAGVQESNLTKSVILYDTSLIHF